MLKYLQDLEVNPALFPGLIILLERGYLYKIKIGDVFDPNSNESDLVASERDLIIFK